MLHTYLIHTYIHTYVRTYIHTYIHTHTHTHTHTQYYCGLCEVSGACMSVVGPAQDNGPVWLCFRARSRPRACFSVLSGRIKNTGLYNCFFLAGLRPQACWVCFRARSRPWACLSMLSGRINTTGPFEPVVGLYQDPGPASAYPRPGNTSITAILRLQGNVTAFVVVVIWSLRINYDGVHMHWL